MLSCASSDVEARLRRSKSASTVHKRPTSTAEPIDMATVRQQAVAAATTAYVRAHAQDATIHITRPSSEMVRSKSNASRKSFTSQGNHFPPRGSSFRSMQAPKFEKSRGRGFQPQVQISTTEQTKGQPSSLYPTSTIGGSTSVPRQLPAQPSRTSSEKARPSSQQKISRTSTASSVTSQQIRKARSMYYASIVQTGSPIGRPPAEYLNTPASANETAVSESPSLHPHAQTLRSSPLAEPRIPVTVAPGVTLDEARDEYLHKFQQKSVKHRPSLFLAPFKKKQEKSNDSAKNTSDTYSLSQSKEQTANEPTDHNALSDFLPPQEAKEKRSFSGSLKNRIRKVFRRTSDKRNDLPVQQIQASRDYFDVSHFSPPSAENTTSIPYPDEATLQRVRGRTSSLDSARPNHLRSGNRSDSTGSGRSTRSLHSEVNAPQVPSSRVTSWGTNSTGDTPTQRTIKRMTVIHESRDSVGSEAERANSSIASKRKSLPLPPLLSFREPMPMETLPEEKPTHVDPKRVFSALMREIGSNKSSHESSITARQISVAESDVLESNIAKHQFQTQNLHSSGSCSARPSIDVDGRPQSRRSTMAHSVRSKTSTIRSFGRAIRLTIRAVTPVGNHSLPGTEDVNLLSNAEDIHKNDVALQSTTIRESEDSQEGDNIAQWPHGINTFIPSASQIERRVEKTRDRWRTQLGEAGNFQFPRETDKTYDVTTAVVQSQKSPSANTEHIEKAEDHNYTIVEQSPRQPQTTPKAVASPQPKVIMTPMSPSIYSRNTDGISITSFDGPSQLERSQNAGSAVILTSQSVRSYVVGTPSPKRQVAAHTSRDWRDWLSHEISGMELSSQEDFSITGQYNRLSKEEFPDFTHTQNNDMEIATSDTKTNDNVSHELKYPGKSLRDRVGDDTGMDTTNPQHYNSFPKNSNIDDPRNIFDMGIAVNSHGGSNPLSQSASFVIKPYPVSTSEGHASYFTNLGTPRQFSNDSHLTVVNTVRCSSSDSLASRRSKSPTDSMTALDSPKSPPRPVSRSSFPSPFSDDTLEPILITPLKIRRTQLREKENLTPQSFRSQKESIAPPQPKMQQPLIPTTPNHSPSRIGEQDTKPHGSSLDSSQLVPTSTPLRPRIRIIARPISPEKLARRPKSAFDLRSTNITARTPTVHITPPPASLPKPSPLFTADSARSDTAGHRMAEEFLRQRNSTTALGGSGGKRRGGMVLVREDTPAFL
ncbi:hypothetical protein COCC4DRAFT_27516 [Bipolaris maydis ATCC 48331]|uniref:Uncharacterized protein n=3 Tax=Cochliobolus heterostrophus TaxID=5016 RepID=M2UP30_COCH5|nr:uncharacterized protein COCC4DRAFT_27516 [Bipolaris maydis ATCC 48331]EMD95326.1 hypothetical protein COCHEDRAFT_1027789 [Bipolaris maydis C5]KAJ5021935.1 hypothetical protein J3E73DRAFT_198767 [Bipolaris maydis]ENI00473.1 hypothetical protein COCC4DRAFT_27516 [Bipolaris maydis ATCC 48331]KAJ5055105.1 hypothetical protein J3E74DRAFT_411547 [Bipolaris maydis]KAJ6202978.1 hypothetical protein J3E72DRAFT_177339 [Bipolaris maydis]